MGESDEVGLSELITLLLYLMAVLLPTSSLTAPAVVLVTAELYFVISAARAGRNVLRPEIPAGLMILNGASMAAGEWWELYWVFVLVSTLTFILWGLKVSLEVEA